MVNGGKREIHSHASELQVERMMNDAHASYACQPTRNSMPSDIHYASSVCLLMHAVHDVHAMYTYRMHIMHAVMAHAPHASSPVVFSIH